MFRVYFGRLGEGKTYAMVKDCHKALRKGDNVFNDANFILFRFPVQNSYDLKVLESDLIKNK